MKDVVKKEVFNIADSGNEKHVIVTLRRVRTKATAIYNIFFYIDDVVDHRSTVQRSYITFMIRKNVCSFRDVDRSGSGAVEVMCGAATHLCDVGVHLAVVGRARQVLALDEALDALLDHHGRGQEARAQLLRHLRHQQRVLYTTHNVTITSVDLTLWVRWACPQP